MAKEEIELEEPKESKNKKPKEIEYIIPPPPTVLYYAFANKDGVEKAYCSGGKWMPFEEAKSKNFYIVSFGNKELAEKWFKEQKEENVTIRFN